MSEKYIAIDIGGTTIKADIYDKNGQSFNQYIEESTSIDLQLQTNQIFNQIDQIIAHYMASHLISGIAISSAGVVDTQSGKIIYSGYTIPGYTGTEFYLNLEKKYQVPVYMDNDVNCAAMGEFWKGAATQSSSLFMVTIGTGIGGSYLLEGSVVTGHHFTAGEVGYLPMNGTDWQSLASTTGLLNLYSKMMDQEIANGKEFFNQYDSNKPEMENILNCYIDYLVDGLLTISYITNPQKMIIGGGIMARDELLIPKIKEKMMNKAMNQRFLPEVTLAAKLGNEAGRIGALYGLLQKISA